MNPATPALPWAQLSVCLLPVLFVCYQLQRTTGEGRGALLATGRMLLQLSFVGYLLVILFSVQSPWPVLGMLVFMLLVASWIALRPLGATRKRNLKSALLALLVGPGLMLALVTQAVLSMESWFEPRFVIPLAGMVLANSMNGLSVAAERFERESSRGAGADEAAKEAMRAGMIGITNSFLAVGLVSFPGMMTGQILAGVSPLLASRYQIMVMCVLFGASGMAISTYLWSVRRTGAALGSVARSEELSLGPDL